MKILDDIDWDSPFGIVFFLFLSPFIVAFIIATKIIMLPVMIFYALFGKDH